MRIRQSRTSIDTGHKTPERWETRGALTNTDGSRSDRSAFHALDFDRGAALTPMSTDVAAATISG